MTVRQIKRLQNSEHNKLLSLGELTLQKYLFLPLAGMGSYISRRKSSRYKSYMMSYKELFTTDEERLEYLFGLYEEMVGREKIAK